MIYSLKKDGPEQSRPMTQGEAYLTHWILEGNTNPESNVLWGSRAQLNDQNGQRRHAASRPGPPTTSVTCPASATCRAAW